MCFRSNWARQCLGGNTSIFWQLIIRLLQWFVIVFFFACQILWLIIVWPLVGRDDCNEADCAGVDLQPAVAWHDDKIRTITRFQAFVKHPHVKANHKTHTKGWKKTKNTSTNTSPQVPVALKACELCFVSSLYRANIFIKLIEKASLFPVSPLLHPTKA